MHMLVIKNTANNTMYTVQELHTFLQTFNGIAFNEITSKVLLESILFPSIFSLHSSTNLSIILFLRLQF